MKNPATKNSPKFCKGNTIAIPRWREEIPIIAVINLKGLNNIKKLTIISKK